MLDVRTAFNEEWAKVSKLKRSEADKVRGTAANASNKQGRGRGGAVQSD